MQQTILSLQGSIKEDCLAKDDEIKRLKEEVQTSHEDLSTAQKSVTEYRMELESSKLEHENVEGTSRGSFKRQRIINTTSKEQH